jgi:hypothetical protein
MTRRERATGNFNDRKLSASQTEMAHCFTLNDCSASAERSMRALATSSITKGKNIVLAKAEAVYDWIVVNTHLRYAKAIGY